jgi:probable F420-dependent oxidoreductase
MRYGAQVRKFRFGFQIQHSTAGDPRTTARAAEDAGFDVISTWDHIVDGWAPLAPLQAMADATTRLRVCPLVLNNDFHHPVHLARELASMDHLSDGRLEVGLGAGHSFTEYATIGMPFDPPRVRKARLAEAVEVLRRLLDGEAVTFDGQFYHFENVRTMRTAQEHLPIMVAVNGRDALAHAALHADTIGLAMLGRTLEDGQRHEVRWSPDRLDSTVAFIRDSAGDRWPALELNALVQRVVITNDRWAAARQIVATIAGLTIDDALATPFLALGTEDEIASQLLASRERWGISYYSVRDLDAFAPVIARLRLAEV